MNQFGRTSYQSSWHEKVHLNGCDTGIFILSGTNWLGQMVRDLESIDAKYTEEEMKERINEEKKLKTFSRLEFGDPGVYEVGLFLWVFQVIRSFFSLLTFSYCP